jgi:hypothetical protein
MSIIRERLEQSHSNFKPASILAPLNNGLQSNATKNIFCRDKNYLGFGISLS